MTRTRKALFGATLYAFAAIFTFGHAAARFDVWLDHNCKTLRQRVESTGTDCYRGGSSQGILAGVFWPLYWSWELQAND